MKVNVWSSLLLLIALVSSCALYTKGPMIETGGEKKHALIVLDMQKDFLLPDGKMTVEKEKIDGLIESVNAAVAEFDSRGDEIVYVRNVFPRNDIGNLFRNNAAVVGRPYTELDERLLIVDGRNFDKKAPDAFSNSELELYLMSAGITDLTVCGVFADQCVYWTARGALARGYSVSYLVPAVAAKNGKAVLKASEDLRKRGVRIIQEP